LTPPLGRLSAFSGHIPQKVSLFVIPTKTVASRILVVATGHGTFKVTYGTVDRSRSLRVCDLFRKNVIDPIVNAKRHQMFPSQRLRE
jgi:hypothetical protein